MKYISKIYEAQVSPISPPKRRSHQREEAKRPRSQGGPVHGGEEKGAHIPMLLYNSVHL